MTVIDEAAQFNALIIGLRKQANLKAFEDQSISADTRDDINNSLQAIINDLEAQGVIEQGYWSPCIVEGVSVVAKVTFIPKPISIKVTL